MYRYIYTCSCSNHLPFCLMAGVLQNALHVFFFAVTFPFDIYIYIAYIHAPNNACTYMYIHIFIYVYVCEYTNMYTYV